MVWDSRRKMLAALGVEILIYGVFAAAMVYELIAAYALSTLHDPSYYLAFPVVLWPLFELILSWWWVASSTKRYAESKYLAQGNTFALTASMLAPILGYVFITSHVKSITILSMVMIGVSLVGHWAARLLWLARKTDVGITPLTQ